MNDENQHSSPTFIPAVSETVLGYWKTTWTSSRK